MKKYNINSEDSSTLNFEELYTVIMKKTRHINFKHSLTKAMRESALRKLNCQKESLMRINTIIVCINDMLSSTVEFMKKSKLKIILNAVIQH